MKIKAFAILDTNVLVSAVISSSGYPYDILRLIQSGNVIPIYDERMLNEYKEVFNINTRICVCSNDNNGLQYYIRKSYS